MNALSPALAVEASTQSAWSGIELHQADADLLALQPELTAARDAVLVMEAKIDLADDELETVSIRFRDACDAVLKTPPARTAAGRALKAAAAMHQINLIYYGSWECTGQEYAWNLLSDIAGDVYVPTLGSDEPPRPTVSLRTVAGSAAA